MTDTQPLSLRRWLVLVLILALICPLLLFGLVYTFRLAGVGEALVLNSLKERGRLQAHALARQLYLPWRNITRLADTVRMDDPIQLRELLTRIVETDQRYLWLGIARTDGRVYAASSGVREGQRVSGRPWFESGLHGSFAGDYHRDPGLAAMLPPQAATERMFDFAAPIRDEEGHTVGVLGAHFDWDEVRSILAGFGADDAQSLLLSADRQVLFGPQGLEGESLRLSTVAPDSRLEPTARIETWPDGKRYVTVTVPEIDYRDLPSFGWRLVIRKDAALALQPVHWLLRHFWIALGIGVAATFGILLLFLQGIAATMRRLADFAWALARGDVNGQPPDEQSFHEAQKLSTALVRLQAHFIPIDGSGQPSHMSDSNDASAERRLRDKDRGSASG
ncbi:cache domain-containing protein [Dichotomicrobium thermohalophilum]|uniref:Cache domain-containing protein n=1 Tax=Dichotomicrobium thermohalophilum TaxID=933063 RepID=A0A397Q1C7_9HYPH|nr:cache domain-containing protein [Dichotomicrobium thermohalophilum]RIA54982.1 cache domain-containing protein [Dichotomicrobium thermohalophilum]